MTFISELNLFSISVYLGIKASKELKEIKDCRVLIALFRYRIESRETI